MKKLICFIIILLPWFVSSLLVNPNSEYYQNLNLPFFTPTPILFTVIWTILYILIALSIYIVYENNNFSNIKDYNKTLTVNYILNQLFAFAFFSIESPFLGFVVTISIFISSLFLYYETKKLNNLSSKLIIPYIVWVGFATILSLTIYFMNF